MNIGSLPGLSAGSISELASVASRPTTGDGGSSFAATIAKVIDESQGMQKRMDQDINDLVTGKADSVHQVVLNVAEADLMFRMLMEVRDRLISSYQEVMRMQI
jgi:flagellar hook-basal body complex protein FliE